MKTRTLCSAALLTILGANLVAPTAAHAAPEALTSEGHIEYVEDNSTNPPTDHEDPGKEIDPNEPVVVNPDGGSLTVDALTNLEFMQQKAVTTDQNYFAKQVPISKNGVDDGVRGNFVQVTDKRIDARTPWTLSAKMTKQFTSTTDTTKTLGGATLTFTNPTINGAGEDKSLFPTLGSQASSFTLSYDLANSVNVMGTNSADEGFGTFTLGFGNTAGFVGATAPAGKNFGTPTAEDSTGTPNAADENKIENGSVNLFVPGNAIKTKSGYTAEVVWTISTVAID
ncbi:MULTISPECIES: WxL domain-containing protein [unclassified Enterococcus]|uniref:WxL domain-containing protein n=1 Tax=unclassified Enterococcus TaxID=2608891 RepID=UPI001CE092DF|nr:MULTISPECIES: WxL domain-containing protein [unclassified Enterococcus]MCA5011430.1 WxL domain-containing protein [Enterococcus sp. S23]MCA5015128.1 WxL domain-containing protein [Enterococcus sp. S22(2020)]